MTRTTNILFKVLGCAVLAATLLAGAMLSLDKNAITGRVALIIKDTTGLDVSFHGPVSLRWFPWIGIELRSVKVASPAGAEAPPLVSIDRADVNLRLYPLMTGRVETGKLTFEGMELNLVRDAAGELNLPKLKIKDVKVEGRNVVVTTEDDTTFRIDYEIAGLDVSGARVNYQDQRSGFKAGISGLSLRSGAVKRGQPFDVSLGLDYSVTSPEVAGHIQLDGKATAAPEAVRYAFDKIALKVTAKGSALPVDALESASGGSLAFDGNAGTLRGDGLNTSLKGFGQTPLSLGLNFLLSQKSDTLEVKDLTAASKGMTLTGWARVAGLTGSPSAEAELSLPRTNPRDVLAALGVSLPATAGQGTLSALQGDFAIKAKGKAASLRSKGLEFDSTKLSLAADYTPAAGQSRPKLSLALKADALNLDHYQAPAGKEAEKGKHESAPAPPALPMDVEAEVEMGSLVASKLHMGPVTAKAALREGVLTADPVQVSLYQGALKATLRADLRKGPNAPLAVNAAIDGVQLEPLLRDATGNARVSGRLTASAAVTATGLDPAKALPTLGGKAAFGVRDGALLGLEVTPEALESGTGRSKPQARTSFEQVSASAAISGGVAHTSDLLVAMSPHKITGQGWVNLPGQTLDMHLMASFVKLPAVPIHVEGKMDDPSISLDRAALAKGMMESVVNAPKEVLKAPGNLGKGALDAVGGFLGKPQKK
ncbi:AsmA family protein [Fundidesulfovibrio agrisoli]|uniref:AsmA family protein n=1 Tax=Fundidesulfovibrio agrisoli TaxID=2922717 RepID=UPI001FAD1C6D|nr:AsmA family protein [Fundidesulfovibrio agrisoli]